MLHDVNSMMTGAGLVSPLQKYVKKIEDGSKDEKTVKKIDSIFEGVKSSLYAAQEIATLYHEMLHAETGDFSLEMEYCDLFSDVIRPVISSLTGYAMDRKIKIDPLDLQNTSKYQRRVFGDKKRLKQVFYNLTKNAIEHSEEGSRITYGIDILVKDGKVIGRTPTCWNSRSFIPEEKRESIWIDKETTGGASGKGTGLGLGIVKDIVENEHRGNIRLESGFDDRIQENYTKFFVDLYSQEFFGTTEEYWERNWKDLLVQ